MICVCNELSCCWRVEGGGDMRVGVVDANETFGDVGLSKKIAQGGSSGIIFVYCVRSGIWEARKISVSICVLCSITCVRGRFKLANYVANIFACFSF